ncbi:phospholipase D-like domain-containing protein [Carbonactinospora thermoautotrophica]|uniref:XRE family transcriptional regulator n=2 Tax=Carbonactinospora thermoautotrophica TaxID=1469144 RepID=UPI0018E349B4|nr:XRE family transcriptional regulator [Carbonactinospora thermoautotrophica]
MSSPPAHYSPAVGQLDGAQGQALGRVGEGQDPKSVERWITKNRTPRRATAFKTAKLLGMPVSWLWPELDGDTAPVTKSEVVAFYPHRSQTPKRLWLDLLTAAEEEISLLAYASLFLPEENPEAIAVLRRKAEAGVKVRIVLGDPDSPEVALRGVEEQLYDAIPARVRMAIAYYRPLVGVPGVRFHLHRTTLYNSIFRFDDEMLINQHIYGVYGYMAPILHLRRIEGCDLFDTYANSFERVWAVSYPIEQITADQENHG